MSTELNLHLKARDARFSSLTSILQICLKKLREQSLRFVDHLNLYKSDLDTSHLLKTRAQIFLM